MSRYSSDQHSTSGAHSKQYESLNHDDVLQLVLMWTLFETGSASVRSGAILSAYIYLCTGSNSTVGYVQGVKGFCTGSYLPVASSVLQCQNTVLHFLYFAAFRWWQPCQQAGWQTSIDGTTS